MITLEQVLFWVTVFTYVAASLLTGTRFVFQSTRVIRWEIFLPYLGLVVNLLTMAVRFMRGGHFFTGLKYEDSLVMAALAVGFYLVLRRKWPAAGPFGLICVPFAFLVLGWGHFSRQPIKPLKAAILSQWMLVHSLFALLGTVCFVLAAGTAVFYLLKSHYSVGKGLPPRLAFLPPLKTLGDLGYRFVLFGFFSWTVMLLSGSLWAKDLYGSYWSWDPVETWSLISWLAWAIYLHIHRTYRERGVFLAWLCIASLLTSLISMWGVGLVSPGTFHELQQLIY